MISPFGRMYLRPGDLWTDFQIKKKIVSNTLGRPTSSFKVTGNISGILAETSRDDSDRTKHRWNQEQHALTHTLVVRGKASVKKGDYLVLEDRVFLVLMHEDVGNLGASSIVYLEERNDLK